MSRHLFLLVGWVSLALGILGIVLPVLPTTPFVLLAAFCFSKGSPRLHQWLLAQPIFGEIIRDWERYGSISKRAKITATVMIVMGFGLLDVFARLPIAVKVLLNAIGASVLVFIWTRPSTPHPPSEF